VDVGTYVNLIDVIWTGTQLVVLGGYPEDYTEDGHRLTYGFVLTSPEGSTWTRRYSSGTTSAENFLVDLVWTGKQVVAIGSNGALATSSDGISWTKRNTGVKGSVGGLAWTGTQLVAVGGRGVFADTCSVWTSPEVLPVPTAIRTPAWQGLSIDLSGSSLHIALPEAMRNRPSSASLYGLNGAKVLERDGTGAASGIVLPVSGLRDGRYLLEIKGAGRRISETFQLVGNHSYR
jgi:hypothetical protein